MADAGNNRIAVFSPAVPLPSGDLTKPTASVASPTNDAVVAPRTVTIRGPASDDVAVAKVEVAVRNVATGKWWNATSAVWQTSKAFNLSALAGTSATSVTYRFAFVGVARPTRPRFGRPTRRATPGRCRSRR